MGRKKYTPTSTSRSVNQLTAGTTNSADANMTPYNAAVGTGVQADGFSALYVTANGLVSLGSGTATHGEIRVQYSLDGGGSWITFPGTERVIDLPTTITSYAATEFHVTTPFTPTSSTRLRCQAVLNGTGGADQAFIEFTAWRGETTPASSPAAGGD